MRSLHDFKKLSIACWCNESHLRSLSLITLLPLLYYRVLAWHFLQDPYHWNSTKNGGQNNMQSNYMHLGMWISTWEGKAASISGELTAFLLASLPDSYYNLLSWTALRGNTILPYLILLWYGLCSSCLNYELMLVFLESAYSMCQIPQNKGLILLSFCYNGKQNIYQWRAVFKVLL